MLKFESQSLSAKFIDPAGQMVERPIEIRIHPMTGRTSRIAFSRIDEKEAGTDSLPPPDAGENSKCPFCRPRVSSETPQLQPDLVITPLPVPGSWAG
jgi:UDPglucose--hexose-1-phosphate uridylyltransferase